MEWNSFIEVVVLSTVLLAQHLFAASLSCSNHKGVCRLYLDQKSVTIDHNLLKNCPDYCTRLSIVSTDSLSRTINQNAFQNFTHLSSLSIHSNLTSMQGFAWLLYLKNLKHLDLSHCGLVSLNTAEFTTGFPSLQTVDLSYNNLEVLYLPFLFDVPQLRYLNISFNRFRNFPDLSSDALVVNIANNILDCTCTNVQLKNRGNFLISNFDCPLSACPYFLQFESSFSNSTLSLQVAESFQFSCNVNASNPVEFGVFSPIGFIQAPSWNSSATYLGTARYEYVVLPVQRPIHITVQRTSRTSFVTAVDYARGHHGGVWRCAALSNGGFLLDNHPYTITIGTCIDRHFLTTTILGFIVMTITLILGLIIGSVRYLVETRCFRQSQSHKFFVRPLIGVIPVPSVQVNKATSVKEISLDQRICPACLVKPAFLCGYCLSVHAFAKFEVLCSESRMPVQPPPQYKHKCSQCLVDASTLLIADFSPSLDQRVNDDEESCTEAIGDDGGKIESEVRRMPHENVLNYGFPSEFCHCYHLDMRFTDDGETRTSMALRDVKLIFRDEQLAQEYTEVLEVLQAAVKSNDAVTFRERLEEFRGRLVRDVGARVRVAREEIVALKERSVKSVARLRGQSEAVAQFMKAGFSQVRDGMRTVAEMCTGGGGGACDDSTTGLVNIGQSISVVSIYKDEMTRKSKERCVSSFTF